ncbi:MAG: phasin [Xanthobacteraceae bacterium]|nr:phasin [Xanthobacteraceae bacterium]
MAKDAMPNFEIPTQMRQFAEQSVEQAKKAVDGFLSAAHKTVSMFEDQAAVAQSGAKSMTDKAMGFAEQNIATSFDFAQRLVRAKDPQEVMQLQAEFIKAQIQRLTEQARELGETAGKAGADAARPKV